MDLQAKNNFDKWMITFTVMLVAIIEVLDITIVNVSLHQMMGAFGATSEQITWILTAYLVSSAIFMPLTGLLVKQFGRRRLLLMNIVGFLIASMLCGVASSLSEMVIFRIFQGAFGASLVPISQFVLRDTFPRKEQGIAMAVWGMGIMTAPVLGPTIGGYITDHLSWRFIFYMNLPVCLFAFLLTLIYIKETPRSYARIDWFGLLLMAVGIGCLQTFLDRGNQAGWFQSNFIVILIVTSGITLYWFIVRGWNRPGNAVLLSVYKDRNFGAVSMILLFFCLAIFGVLTLQPIMLGTLYHYSPELTGLVMAPRGLVSMVTMALCPLIMRYINPKAVAAIGLALSAYGTFLMSDFSLDASMWVQIYPSLFQGAGMALVFVPISSVAFDYLKPETIPDAAGLFSFGRSMGTSIGISIMSTVVSRMTQINWNQLVGYIRPDNPNFQQWLVNNGFHSITRLALYRAQGAIHTQSSMVAFIDAYWLAGVIFLAIIPLIFLMKKSKYAGNMPVGH